MDKRHAAINAAIRQAAGHVEPEQKQEPPAQAGSGSADGGAGNQARTLSIGELMNNIIRAAAERK